MIFVRGIMQHAHNPNPQSPTIPDSLTKATVGQPPGQLFFVLFSRLSLHTQLPKHLAGIMIAKLTQRFVDKDEHRGERVEVVRLVLPPLQILDDFRRFLAFTKVDEVAREMVFAAVLYVSERGQEYAWRG